MSARFPLFRLLVITGAIFVCVTSEFLPTGLLPDIARELHVSLSQVGLLVTAFAGTVVITTAPLTALTHRVPRKSLMIITLAVFSVANVLAAIAPAYGWLMAARILGGLAHGLFWAVTNPYTARLVPRHQLTRAIAVTAAGGSAAFVLGVPLGTALGHAVGWRLAFATMAGVILVFLLLVVFLLPPVSHIVPLATGEIPVPMRHDRTVPVVVIVCVTVLLLSTGQNTFYTYITPWLTQAGGIPPAQVPTLLFVYGAAGAVGLVAAGVFGDRFPRGALIAAAGGVMIAVGVLAAFGSASVVAVLIGVVGWSVAFGGVPSLLQTRVMHGASMRLRDLGSAWVTIAFNLSIGGGALLGGLLLDGFGIRILPLALIVFAGATVVWMLATDRFRIARHPG